MQTAKETHTKNKTSWLYWFLSAHLHSEESSQSGKFIILAKFTDFIHQSLRFPYVAARVRISLTRQQMIDIYQLKSRLVSFWNYRMKALILFDLNNSSLTPFTGQAVEDMIVMKWQRALSELKTKRDFSKWRERVKPALNCLPQRWWEDLDSKRNRKCFIMNLECIQSKSVHVLRSNLGSRFEPMWINKFHSKKYLISSLRKHLMLSPVVSKPITTASKITPKANPGGRNCTIKWVTKEQNG